MPESKRRSKKRIKKKRIRMGDSQHRSLQHRKPFIFAVAWASLHYLFLLATVTAFVAFWLNPTQLATRVIIGCIVLSGISWWIAFFRRRAALCPLCRGTPLINSGALTHEKAFRFGPFNHGVTAIFSILATQSLRCMYCGSHFDMLKTPSNRRRQPTTTAPPEEAEVPPQP